MRPADIVLVVFLCGTSPSSATHIRPVPRPTLPLILHFRCLHALTIERCHLLKHFHGPLVANVFIGMDAQLQLPEEFLPLRFAAHLCVSLLPLFVVASGREQGRIGNAEDLNKSGQGGGLDDDRGNRIKEQAAECRVARHGLVNRVRQMGVTF